MIGSGRFLAALLALSASPMITSAQDVGVEPGQWEITVTVDSMEMPSAPPMVAGLMVGRSTTISHCLTPEEAVRGPQDMLKSSKACVFTRYSMRDGQLSSEMVCQQGRDQMTTAASGSFTPTRFTATGRSVTTGSVPMTMTSTSFGRRVGDCED